MQRSVAPVPKREIVVSICFNISAYFVPAILQGWGSSITVYTHYAA